MTGARIELSEVLDDPVREEVLTLAAARSLALGREALTDQARRTLTLRGAGLHLLRWEGTTLTGYGVVHLEGGIAELELLGDDLSSGLLEEAAKLAAQRSGTLRVWIHGIAGDPAAPLPGMTVARSLLRLHRPLPAAAPGHHPESIVLRPFRPGIDDEAWLGVNARSFAAHPDQGGMRQTELDQRIAEGWFDPEGFLLAWRGEELTGFCWTKMHRDPWGDVGEIYVIGIDPTATGLGLGRFLLRAGLAHMVDVGMSEAMLYVETDNDAAVGLYGSEGFTTQWNDACWVARTL
jgi:mycothiol synthase